MSPTSFNDLLNMDTQQLLDNFLTAEPSVTERPSMLDERYDTACRGHL